MSRKSDREIRRLKTQILQKDEQIQAERHKSKIDIIKEKAMIRAAFEIKLKNELTQAAKLHDTER